MISTHQLLLLTAFVFSNTVIAQTTTLLGPHSKVFVVRHAEKLTGTDPLLTDDGNKRAGDLMRALNNEHIKRIYVTQYKRTQHTADSLQLQLGIDTVQVLADTSCAALFAAITKNKDWDQPILIVSHSNIVQKIIYKLGITGFPQEYLPENEFDNLYRVSLKDEMPVLLHTKYGQASAASAPMKQ